MIVVPIIFELSFHSDEANKKIKILRALLSETGDLLCRNSHVLWPFLFHKLIKPDFIFALEERKILHIIFPQIVFISF